MKSYQVGMILAIIASLFLVQGVFALQEVAGPLVISTPIGGNNSAKWGLINDGSATITAKLSASGDAAQYLSYPPTVVLQPGKVVYVNVTAIIPADYSSAERNVTGYLYALQEGTPGQVQINIQMMKSVTIEVTGQLSNSNQASSLKNLISTSQMTGLVALVSGNYLTIALVVIILILAFAIFKIKIPKKNLKKIKKVKK
jgi:hypothetical protein